jgi:S1-C subfamily serine protease
MFVTGCCCPLIIASAATKQSNERYTRLSCAVVQIVSNQGSGTGFFISKSGDVLTAAHVALNQTFTEREPGKITNNVDYKPGLRIRQTMNRVTALALSPLSESDTKMALSDLAILKTGIKTPCFFKLSKHPKDLLVGFHVVALGFPESEPETADTAFYDGIISARYKHLAIPIAVVNDKPVYPNYDVLRIQMPITPGDSGGPVVADDDDVVAVITENPTIWFNDLNNVIAFGQQTNGGFNAPISDLPKIVAKLAWVVHEFLSSGAGLAVPVSYLEAQERKAR